jgi:CRP-like cAMP-binding protein
MSAAALAASRSAASKLSNSRPSSSGMNFVLSQEECHMHASFPSQDNPMIRKLESIFTLTDDERQALENLPMQLAVIKDNQDIVREGDRPSRSCLLLSGFTATYKVTKEGKR